MVMKQDICDFIQYLHQEKQTSENTEVSYERDLTKMSTYLKLKFCFELIKIVFMVGK